MFIKRLLAAVLAFIAMSAFAAVDVNRADAAALDSIKGIGPSISASILEERKKGPYKSWEDLVDRVKGIGEGNAAKMSEAGLTVNGAGFKGMAAAPKKDEKPAASPAKAAPTAAPAAAATTAAPAAPAAPAAVDDKKAKAEKAKADKEAKKAAADKEKADKKAAADKEKAEKKAAAEKAKADKAAAKKTAAADDKAKPAVAAASAPKKP
jgi:competence protein ComEA